MCRAQTHMAPLWGFVVHRPPDIPEAPHGRSFVSCARRRGVRRLCRASRRAEEDLTMIAILWGVGAVVVAVYMIAALVRPERF
ncbi:potassium-transporting ATPase subunit F [Brevundimonas sp.]|uniref:potassium-transporting ATPase subunit F n=1 Tax=Brevundimonas sp. TaxID=1871086 RepID=UPI001A1EF8A9|nr:potassium-transporting ATPase subunit F [Brevundimonas sp.]